MKAFLTIGFLLAALITLGQDQIFKKDNTKVDAKIIEINTNEVKYKLFTYQDGPVIVLNKSEIALIIYQNGSHETFNTPAQPVQPVQPVPATGDAMIDYRTQRRIDHEQMIKDRDEERKEVFNELVSTKNLVMFNMLECLNGGVGFSYLREFAHNNLAVYVPLSFGFAPPAFTNTTIQENYRNYNVSNYGYTQKTFDVGLGLNLQTNTKYRVTHFIGPLLNIAQYNGTFTTQEFYSNYVNISHGFVMNRYSVCINNGFLFRITKHFNFMIHAAVGFHQDVFVAGTSPLTFKQNQSYYYGNNIITYPFNTFRCGLNFGYRF
jgi:hypothetical protein